MCKYSITNTINTNLDCKGMYHHAHPHYGGFKMRSEFDKRLRALIRGALFTRVLLLLIFLIIIIIIFITILLLLIFLIIIIIIISNLKIPLVMAMVIKFFGKKTKIQAVFLFVSSTLSSTLPLHPHGHHHHHHPSPQHHHQPRQIGGGAIQHQVTLVFKLLLF